MYAAMRTDMKIYEEKSLRNFEFWSGAKDRAENLTDEELDMVESELEQLYPDGMEDTQLNDIFWFEFDMIAELLGYEDEADFDRRHDPFYIDDDDLVDCIEDYWQEFLNDAYEAEDEEYFERIVTDLFGEDTETVLEDCTEAAIEQTPKGVYYHFLLTNYDCYELTETLLDDDQGSEVLSDFPTKEEFRELMMDRLKQQNKK